MVRCYCSLGGNLGPVGSTFDQAVAELRRRADVRVTAVSTYHRTAAVGAADEAGGEYLNAALALETSLEPLALLDLLQSLEAAQGRVRERRWGARTLDLDLLFYGDRILDLPRLQVPHPGAWFRRFVLDPLCEIAPELIHPVKGLSIRALRGRLLPRPLSISLAGGTAERRDELISQIQPEFPAVTFLEWQQREPGGTTGNDPAFIVWLPDSSAPLGFEQLPAVPRIAATEPAADYLRYLCRAALGNG